MKSKECVRTRQEGERQMSNLILFVNAFLSYLLLFVLIIAVVAVACIIGVKWRKSKDAKNAAAAGEGVQTDGVSGNTAV